MNLWSTFLLVAAFALKSIQGESVDFTVEGGGSLVGEFCPGTVRLFCEGVELTNLRLIYNESFDSEIDVFFPDAEPTNITDFDNPAFVSINLTRVSRESIFANFSLYLTVDLFELHSQRIESISCGNNVVIDREVVNITITPEASPNKPQVTAVNVTYESDILSSLGLAWNKTEEICPAYTTLLGYKVTLDGINSSTHMVTNYSSCDEDLCSAIFSNLPQSLFGAYVVTIVAFNNAGTSDPEVYPREIEIVRSQDLLPMVSGTFEPNGCLIIGRCNATCFVQYSTDRFYRNLSDSITANGQFSISGLSPNTTYYFEISSFSSDRLFVTNRFSVMTESYECDSQSVASDTIGTILGSVFGIIVLLVLVCMSVISAIILYKRKTSWSVSIPRELESVTSTTIIKKKYEMSKETCQDTEPPSCMDTPESPSQPQPSPNIDVVISENQNVRSHTKNKDDDKNNTLTQYF